VHVSLFQRPQAELATYRHLDLVTSSYPLTRELGRTAAAAVVSELLTTFCPPAEPSEKAFRLGLTCLEGLLSGIPVDTVVAYAQFWMLALGGVLPSGSDIVESLGESNASTLAAYRQKKLEVSGRPPAPVCKWLDGLVREEADRPLRALRFYRQTILGGEESDA
jgi:recombinational DNA repair protein (RecF pathway)